MSWAQTNRFIVTATLLTLLCTSNAQALGLGEARVDSYLNQRLDVRIRLLDISDDELDSLTVSPANPEAYQRLGLDSSALAMGLEATIDRSQSPPIIRITSERSVSDPVVQLLIDARWANGRLLREYTLFLDPATLDVAPPPRQAQAAEPRPAAEPDRAAPTRPTRPTPSAPASESRPDSRPRPAAQARASGPGVYGPVASGETLWSIAMANLPAGEVTMDQMMLAIVELNPQAFRNGNINQMLRGSELRLPDVETAGALNPTAAAETVRAQNRAFNQRLGGDVPVVSDAARGRDSDDEGSPDSPDEPERERADSPVATTRDEAQPRLELVPPTDQEGGSGLDDDGEEVDRLRQQLARAEEELFTARLETEEFQSRVTELESMVLNNPTGAGVADVDLAGLEQTLRAARLATEEDADPEMRAEVSARLDEYIEQFETADAEGFSALNDADGLGEDEFGGAGSDDPTVADAGDDVAGDAEPVDAQDEADAGGPEPVVTQVGSRSSSPWSNPLVLVGLGIGALVLLLGGAYLALQRRRRDRGMTPKSDPDFEPVPTPTAGPVDRARARVEENPRSLAAHLALVKALAATDDHDDFDQALEDMFEHVETGEEPAWREAVEIAARVSPEHVLVKGSADWMSGPVANDTRRSEVDEESEVGDLMSRLDADLDESDDRDWMDDDGADSTEDERTPLLRDGPARKDEIRDRGPMSADDSAIDDRSAAEESIDDLEDWTPDTDESTVPDEEDERQWLGDSLVDRSVDDDTRRAGDQSIGSEDDGEDGSEDGRADAAEADRAARSDSAAAGSPADDEDDGLSLDWMSDSDSEDQASDASTDEDADADIFAPGDDDADVKLDLARAYLSWNSTDSARTLLEEVIREGNEDQKEQAQKLLDDL